MKIKNTAPGGRGFGVGGQPYEIGPGATSDIPDAIVKAARLDPSVDLMFTNGTFVVDAGKPAAAAESEAEAEPAAKADKGKPAK